MEKKQKFYDGTKNNIISYIFKDFDAENSLLQNIPTKKEKTQLELNQTLDPFDYDTLMYSTVSPEITNNVNQYLPAYNQGPGRGFGNLNVSNDIRNGHYSRSDNDCFKISRESLVLDRFDFVDDRFRNPNNYVLPFPRSGDTTRKISASITPKMDDSYKYIVPKKYKVSDIKINY